MAAPAAELEDELPADDALSRRRPLGRRGGGARGPSGHEPAAMSAQPVRTADLERAGLLGDGVGAARTYEVRDVEIELLRVSAPASPISGHVRLSRTNRGILADAHLKTALAGECARCLRPLATPIDIDLEEEYLPSIDLATGRAVETASEPDALRLTDHHELDLSPSVSDAISLAEPIAPLDRPDCGLVLGLWLATRRG